jgi:creatinine amidohydrolase/Fe(II)-dependent formamide hydrolase-like protein
VFESLFAQGVEALSETGVIGDPRRASAERGRMYVERLVDLAAEMVERESR